jgi:hypothetical protein
MQIKNSYHGGGDQKHYPNQAGNGRIHDLPSDLDFGKSSLLLEQITESVNYLLWVVGRCR